MIISSQNLFDIAIERSGSVLAAFDWALKNGKSITDNLSPGETLIVPETEYKDLSVKEYFLKKSIATNITAQETDVTNPQLGIGSMIIETNFIVY